MYDNNKHAFIYLNDFNAQYETSETFTGFGAEQLKYNYHGVGF